jgi:hypothetical protein
MSEEVIFATTVLSAAWTGSDDFDSIDADW